MDDKPVLETKITSVWTPDGEAAVPTSAAEAVSEAEVINAIASVYDPEIPINIYELGLIYSVEIEGSYVKVEMTLTAPGCPSAQELPESVRLAIGTIRGVSEIDVSVVWDPPWDPSRMSDEARLALNMY